MPNGEIDPTESEYLRQTQPTEFSDMDVDAQTMVRELLESPGLDRIIIHDGGTHRISIWGTAGRWAGSVATQLADHGFDFGIWQRGTDNVEFTATREGQQDEY